MRGRPYIGGLTRSPVGGDRPPLSPAGGATGPPGGPTGLSPVGGTTDPPLFFLQGLRCKFKEKKLYLSPVAPHRATGVYF